MNKDVLMDEDLIAPCGLYCGECEAFQDERCSGCISRIGLCLKYSKICKIYECCVSEGKLRFCNECKAFPCIRFNKFFDSSEWYNEVVGNLKRIGTFGVERVLKEQVRRVTALIECAEDRKIKHCSRCKDWPCKKLERPPLVPA